MPNKQTNNSGFPMLVAIIALFIGGTLGWLVKPAESRMASTQQQVQQDSPEMTLTKDMRKLWEDHITYTRSYLVSAAYDNPDTDNVAARLLKNQEDIGNAIKPYYGEEAGNQLTTLLKEHITTAVELVTAAKQGDQDAQNAANEKWYANADEIADFLATANPNWPRNDLRAEMKSHLDLTKQEAVNILNNNYDAGIADYDKVHVQILIMSDMLSAGIIKQFPDKF